MGVVAFDDLHFDAQQMLAQLVREKGAFQALEGGTKVSVGAEYTESQPFGSLMRKAYLDARRFEWAVHDAHLTTVI